MKLFLIWICSLLIQISVGLAQDDLIPDIPPTLQPEEIECVNELGLNETRIEELNAANLAPENDLDYATFLSCYWKKMKWMQLDGTLNVDKLKDSITNAALADVDGTDVTTKVMVNLMVQNAFKKCYSTMFAFPNLDPVQSPIKAQNCVLKALRDVIAS